MAENNLLIYKNKDGNIIVDAIYKDETLWLSQKGMSRVFEVGVPAISKHLKNVFEEEELDKDSVVSKMEITASDGKNYNTEVYSLDAIKLANRTYNFNFDDNLSEYFIEE